MSYSSRCVNVDHDIIENEVKHHRIHVDGSQNVMVYGATKYIYYLFIIYKLIYFKVMLTYIVIYDILKTAIEFDLNM